MSNLRNKLVKLANDNPDGIREHLVPILKETSTTKQAGYTHYWDILRPFTDQEWSKIIQVSKQIIAKAARTTKLKAPLGIITMKKLLLMAFRFSDLSVQANLS